MSWNKSNGRPINMMGIMPKQLISPPTGVQCLTKHYYPPADKALPAVVLGVIARVGSVNGQRVAIVTHLVRADPDDPSEATLQAAVVRQAAETLAEDEIPVFDAGFKIRELQAASQELHRSPECPACLQGPRSST
jgi:hypothetical protein